MLSGPHIKMASSFTILSNVAITTQKFVNNMGTKFFGNAVFKSKKVTQTIFRLENNFNGTLGQRFFLKQLYNLDLKFKENWTKKGTIKTSFLGTVIIILLGT